MLRNEYPNEASLGTSFDRLYFGHDNSLELATSEEQKKKIKNCFVLLTKELESNIYRSNKNPFDIKFHMIESAREPGVYQRMKPSCCLYYQTEGASSKCYGCPRMNDEEREQRRQEIRARIEA
ncbi:hypothetical protein [Halalkalibacter lacteus]|uniref:hypothetical protein n=1 Tax=Halalkalibacter lacteus TaxID=3090663 RepID=UPI002FC792AD